MSLPIRLRLTLAFALAMAVVLAATGAFLHVRLAESLDEAIDERLQARAAELAPLVAEGEPLPSGVDEPDERFSQVVEPAAGRVLAGDHLSGPLLDRRALGKAASGARWFQVENVSGVDGRARVLATPVDVQGSVVLLVGESLEDRDETLTELLTLLLVVGPIALALASLLGYALATAAFRPVEAMRAEASSISASEPGRRLPLPDARDEVRRLGQTLNQMLERLESALERERAFVADAGHDLRTPLAALKAELELALRRPRTAAELEGAIRSAAEETDRLARLAEDLLLLARSDQRRLPLRLENVSTGDLMARVAERYGAQAGRAARRIEVRDEPLELTGDPVRLEQALANLVENALRHGGGTVRLTAAERDGTVELHVVDEGAGFPAELLPHAFDRFTRGDAARSGEGAGLGLAIADAIAKAHGGTAHAENRGSGADVWLAIRRR
jgi:two-component system OmpR family sensor kinase